MDKINKKERIAHLFKYITFAAIISLAYLIYRFKFDLFSLGGSLMLAAIIYILFSLKSAIKPLSLELSSAALMVTSIVVINFLSYWEINSKIINMTYLIIAYMCLYFFVAITSAIFGLPFKKISSVKETDHRDYLEIMRTLSMPIYIFGLVFAMISGLMVYFILVHEPAGITWPFLKITYIAVFWLVIALFITFIYLSKIKDEDIRKFLLEDKLGIVSYDIKKVKKYFEVFFLLIILFGSMVETQRGMWVLWLETILLLGLLSVVLWKIYKHILR